MHIFYDSGSFIETEMKIMKPFLIHTIMIMLHFIVLSNVLIYSQ